MAAPQKSPPRPPRPRTRPTKPLPNAADRARAEDRRKTFDRDSWELHTAKAVITPKLARLAEPVPAIYPTTLVRDAGRLMLEQRIRRLPVVDAGQRFLIGELLATDLLNFFGGGEKFNIVKAEFGGSLPAALGAATARLMHKEPLTVDVSTDIEAAFGALKAARVGSLFVVGPGRRVLGRLTERMFLARIGTACYTGLTVADVMQPRVVTATPRYHVLDALEVMVRNGYRRLPVVSEDALVGILTYIDLLRFFTEGVFTLPAAASADAVLLGTTVGSLMSRDAVTVSPEAELAHAAGLMVATGHGGLPVLAAGRLVGIITQRDIINAVV